MLAVQQQATENQVKRYCTISTILHVSPQSGQKVKVYLRKVNKETFIQYIQSPARYRDIFTLAQNKFGLRSQSLILYWRGQKIQQSNSNTTNVMKLQQNDIIHIHNIKNVNKSSIKIFLKSFECTKSQHQLITIETSPKNLIGHTIQRYFNDLIGITLIESGRKLDVNKSFEDESVQSQATIIATSFNKQRINKSHTKIENKSTLKSTEASECLQYQKQNKKINMAELNFKRRTSWSHSNQAQIGSFKKKSKPSVYISINDSEGEDVIWESESSSELSKPNHIQKLAIRKATQLQNSHKQILSLLQGKKSDENTKQYEKKEQKNINFDISMIIPLNGELFKSQLQNRKQIKQPPLITFNDFQEEQELEIQIKEFEDEKIQMQDKEQNCENKPINLGASIGKARGNFIPIIPTKNIVIDDDDSDDQQF